MDASKKQLIKELREYLDKVEKDETTYCELLMEIPELLKGFNCDQCYLYELRKGIIDNEI